jgi:LysR family transcriptional regulator, nitrogen assimilation regulatory protein
MDLKQLATFVHVAELGSFTRAAAVLRVAQPALSRQVRSLEVELRQTLLNRNGRGVTLTEAGKRFLGHGRAILQQVERALQDLEDHRGAVVGRLALGVPPSVGRLLTAPLVAAFRERFPKATLTIVEGLSTYLLEWLLQGRVDCAVVYNVAPSPALELVPVLQEPLFLVSVRARAGTAGVATGRRQAHGRRLRGDEALAVSRASTATKDGAAVSLADLAQCDLVIPSRPHAIRMQLETAMAAARLKPRVALEIESVPAMLDLVEHPGQHPLHAVLGRNALRGHEAQLQARPIVIDAAGRKAQPLYTTLWLATAAQRPSSAIVQQGAQLVHEKLLELWQP